MSNNSTETSKTRRGYLFRRITNNVFDRPAKTILYIWQVGNRIWLSIWYFHWLSIIFTIGRPVSSHSFILVLIGQSNWDGLRDHLRDVPWDARIYLYLVLLLLLVNFVSRFRMELMYISLIGSIRSSLAHLHDFQLLMYCCHTS